MNYKRMKIKINTDQQLKQAVNKLGDMGYRPSIHNRGPYALNGNNVIVTDTEGTYMHYCHQGAGGLVDELVDGSDFSDYTKNPILTSLIYLVFGLILGALFYWGI